MITVGELYMHKFLGNRINARSRDNNADSGLSSLHGILSESEREYFESRINTATAAAPTAAELAQRAIDKAESELKAKMAAAQERERELLARLEASDRQHKALLEKMEKESAERQKREEEAKANAENERRKKEIEEKDKAERYQKEKEAMNNKLDELTRRQETLDAAYKSTLKEKEDALRIKELELQTKSTADAKQLAALQQQLKDKKHEADVQSFGSSSQLQGSRPEDSAKPLKLQAALPVNFKPQYVGSSGYAHNAPYAVKETYINSLPTVRNNDPNFKELFEVNYQILDHAKPFAEIGRMKLPANFSVVFLQTHTVTDTSVTHRHRKLTADGLETVTEIIIQGQGDADVQTVLRTATTGDDEEPVTIVTHERNLLTAYRAKIDKDQEKLVVFSQTSGEKTLYSRQDKAKGPVK